MQWTCPCSSVVYTLERHVQWIMTHLMRRGSNLGTERVRLTPTNSDNSYTTRMMNMMNLGLEEERSTVSSIICDFFLTQ